MADLVRVEFLADLLYLAKGHERILELVGRLFLDLAAATVDAIHRPAADILFHIRRRRVRNRALERAFRNLAWAIWLLVKAGIAHMRAFWIGFELGTFALRRALSIAGSVLDRKSTRLNSSHQCASRMPSSACQKKRQKS